MTSEAELTAKLCACVTLALSSCRATVLFEELDSKHYSPEEDASQKQNSLVNAVALISPTNVIAFLNLSNDSRLATIAEL